MQAFLRFFANLIKSVYLSLIASRYSSLCNVALKRYVFVRGAHLAELLSRSIFARDWLACSEPRGPRPIVKNIVDEIRNLNEKNTRSVRLIKSETVV